MICAIRFIIEWLDTATKGEARFERITERPFAGFSGKVREGDAFVRRRVAVVDQRLFVIFSAPSGRSYTPVSPGENSFAWAPFDRKVNLGRRYKPETVDFSNDCVTGDAAKTGRNFSGAQSF